MLEGDGRDERTMFRVLLALPLALAVVACAWSEGGTASDEGSMSTGGSADVVGSGGGFASGGAATGGAAAGGVAATGGGVGSGGGVATGGAFGGSGGASATGGAAAGGSGGGACVTTEPPAEFVETIEATWDEMTGQIAAQGSGARPPNASVLNFTNTILDQIMETGGTLNYCVRYESTVTMSAVQRDKLEAALERNVNEWIEKLDGVDCFPYDHVPVKVVGWAAMNRSTFGWPDGDHPGLLYIGDDTFENAPQCAQACGRFFNRQAGFQYPGCSGGRANHYDMSLWLTEGMNGGAGGDWGQRVGRGYFMNAIDQTTLHILSHEIGHGFGFPDYYNWSTWFPGLALPPSIMVAGAQNTVTAWDAWMFRRTWSELKADRGF